MPARSDPIPSPALLRPPTPPLAPPRPVQLAERDIKDGVKGDVAAYEDCDAVLRLFETALRTTEVRRGRGGACACARACPHAHAPVGQPLPASLFSCMVFVIAECTA